jgi:hypothetical protein
MSRAIPIAVVMTSFEPGGTERQMNGPPRDRGIFNDGAVATVWREHRDGRQDDRHRLWSLVMPELWFRQLVDGSARKPGSIEAAA